MYVTHQKLKNQTEEIYCLVDQFSIAVKDKKNKKPNLLSEDEDICDLISEDTYDLLETINLVSQKPLHVLINELEIRYSEIIFSYAYYYYKMPKSEINIDYKNVNSENLFSEPSKDDDDDEIYKENFYLDGLLDEKIEQINAFCENYLGIDRAVLLSNDEYKIIALCKIFHRTIKAKPSDFIELFNTKYESLTGIKLTKEEITLLKNKEDFVKSPTFRVNFSKNSLLPEGHKYIDSSVLESLRKYLIDEDYIDTSVSNIDFDYVSQNKKLPKGIQKLNWKKKPANACRFADFLNMKYEDFNQCFALHNKKLLTSSNKSAYGYPPFAEYLDNLL